MTDRVLLVATLNVGKRVEITRLLRAGLGDLAGRLEVRDLAARPGYEAPVEDGETYLDNALLKARAAAGGDAAVLADDSGIEVAALGGAPGIRSARWALTPAGGEMSGSGRNRALLARVGDTDRRDAAMVSNVVLLVPGLAPVVGRGRVEGTLAREERGSGGFGYDAIFLLRDGRRLSEVAGAEKDRVGHRGQAVRAVLPALMAWIKE